jgi:putative membrane protein
MKGFICGALLCSLAGISLYATAQSTPTHATGTGADSPSATQATLAASDQKFFKKAAIGGMSEVAAGQLASQQGTDPGVKAFGQQMVTDHQKANDELKMLAQQKGVTLPADPDATHQKALDQLKSKQGKTFDTAYARQEVKDHNDTISLFQAAARSKDPDISAFAQKTLPTLQHHLGMAKDLNKATS